MIEYATVPTHGLPLGGETLQQMGKEGWQLVTIEHGIAYFSRQKPEPEPEPKKTTRRKKAAQTSAKA